MSIEITDWLRRLGLERYAAAFRDNDIDDAVFILERAAFPTIRTFDSSRSPKRGERLAMPGTLAAVDLTAIVAALAASEHAGKPNAGPRVSSKDRERQAQLERELAAAKARIETL